MGMGDLTLEFHYPDKAGRGAVNETLTIPMVTNFERSINVNLTEMPTLIYGCRNNFCMDLGATEKITFKCERNCPLPCNDSSRNPEDWSNGKWYRHLEWLFDRWQNFGRSPDGTWTGGLTMSFVPEDTTLLAPVKGNVFLVGSLSVDYAIQRMTFSLPLQLASMKPGDTAPMERVTLTLRTATDSQGTLTEEVSVLKGFPQTVDLPEDWKDVRKGMVFMGWQMGDITIGTGNSYTFTSDATLTAIWRGASDCYWFTSDGTMIVPTNVNYMELVLVGGGGGGGGGGGWRAGVGAMYHWVVGGGGGSGDVVTQGTTVSPGDTIRVICGEGGSGGTNRPAQTSTNPQKPTNGGAGGDTIVYLNGAERFRAKGGEGGRAATLATNTFGAAGSYYAKGGAHAADADHATDGEALDPNVQSNAGTGGKDAEKNGIVYRGGAGGGAAALMHSYTLSNGTHRPTPSESASGFFESKGGNGEDCVAGTDATDGMYGGGGGSGRKTDYQRAGVGGTGVAIVLFFERYAS